MCVWRAFYAIYLDLWSFRGAAGARRDRGRDMRHFADSLRSAMLLSLASCAVLQVGRGAGLPLRGVLLFSNTCGMLFCSGAGCGAAVEPREPSAKGLAQGCPG